MALTDLLPASFARRRARAAARASGPLAAFYAAHAPAEDTPTRSLPLLAVDIETTGLDARTDHVLSLGWVPVEGDTIVLGAGGHRVLATEAEVGQSAVFHGITDDQVAAGTQTVEALADLLEALAGRVMLVHFAHIETTFLDRLCRQHFGAGLVVPVVDTLALHDRLINRGFDDESRAGQLRLAAARQRYGLPRYRAHNALVDALACAELYLGHVAEVEASAGPRTLRDLAARA